MAMGGGLAVSDRRYALAARKQRDVIERSQAESAPALAGAPAKAEARN